jgi:hypothetical protein
MIDLVEGVEVALEMGEVSTDKNRVRQRIAHALDDRLEILEDLLSLRCDATGQVRSGRGRVSW